MTDLFFIDLPAAMQAKIAQDLATVHDSEFNLVFKALGTINPIIDTDKKVTWQSFCLLTGFIIGSEARTNDPAALARIQKKHGSCQADFARYKNLNS